MGIFERIECRICGLSRNRQGDEGTFSLRSKMDQYANADHTERLYLWLQHRELRDEFNGLEEKMEG